MSSWASSSWMLVRSTSLSSTMSSLLRRGLVYSRSFSIAEASPSVVAGLVTKENAPRLRPCCRFSSRVTICTGMWRRFTSCFMWLRTVHPSMSGRNTSRETAPGRNSRASSSASVPLPAMSTLNP